MSQRRITLTITIPGEPTAWARARSAGKMRFTPHKQAVAMDVIRFEALRVMRGQSLLDGPLRVQATFVYQWPRSWSQAKRLANRWKTSRPDIDNLSKLVGDALNEIVWADDALIVEATISKLYDETPRTTIIVEMLS